MSIASTPYPPHVSLPHPAARVARAAAGLMLALSGALAGPVGCAGDRPKDVPQTAALKAEGDQRVVYAAEQDGTVWVTEKGSNDILYSGQVNRGDRLTLDPDAGKLMLNDHVVADKGVGHLDHKVFFLPGPPVPSPTVAAAHDVTLPRPPQVPPAAVVKGEGKERVEYTADADGSVWVVDTDNNTVVYSGRLRRGETLAIDPKNPKDNQLTVGGRAALTGDLPSHNRRVFFQPGPDPRDLIPPPAPAAAVTVVPVAPADGTVVVRPTGVPAAADLRAESPSRTEFVADRDGTVWVVDATTGRIVYSGRMVRGDALAVDPTAGRLTLNGRPATDATLVSGDRYRVFYRGGL